jgi:A/G-specific adenine glycosylase
MLLAQRPAPPAGPAWLVRRRPPRGIWGGLWEFPWVERRAEEESAAGLCAALLAEAGETAAPAPTSLGHLSHGLTHFQLELDCLRLALPGARSAQTDPALPLRWATAEELAALPLARISHKALALLARHAAGAPPAEPALNWEGAER